MKYQDIIDYYEGNKKTIEKLIIQVKNNNIIPFVGAGLSAFCYPTWKEILRELAKQIADETYRKKVFQKIEQDKLKSAAQVIENSLGKMGLRKGLQDILSPDKLLKIQNKWRYQAVSLLPYLFSDIPVVTTNFDSVIEEIYNFSGKEFPLIVNGKQKTEINRALQGRERFIFKIHGDKNGKLVFTKKDYKKAYAAQSWRVKSLKRLFKDKTLLFLGCSLDVDETIKLLKRTTEDGIIHYAIVELRDGEDWEKRMEDLKERKIYPIIYPTGHHESVRLILEWILKKIKNETYESLPYHESKHSDEALVKNPFRYDSGSTEIVGRDDEIKMLKTFCANDADFLWWMIVGPGGSGKTRLAYEFRKRLETEGLNGEAWEVYYITPTDRDKPKEIDQNSKENVLLIMDYAYAYLTTITRWIQNAAEKREKNFPKVRYLLLDREEGSKPNQAIYSNIFVEANYISAVKSTHYKNENDKPIPITLNVLGENFLINIMQSFIKNLRKSNDKIREFTEVDAANLLQILKKSKALLPLYAMYVADAWAKMEKEADWEELMAWGEPDIVKYGADRVEEYYHKRADVLYGEVNSRIHLLLNEISAIATIWGGISISDFKNNYSKIWPELQNEIEKLKKVNPSLEEDFFQNMDLLSEKKKIIPIVPDLIGEYFVFKKVLGSEEDDIKKRYQSRNGLFPSNWLNNPEIRNFVYLISRDYKDELNCNPFMKEKVNEWEKYLEDERKKREERKRKEWEVDQNIKEEEAIENERQNKKTAEILAAVTFPSSGRTDKDLTCLRQRLHSLSDDKQLHFSSFCAEYVGICDDISKQEEAFLYELPVYDYICNLQKFSFMPEEKKAKIYRIVNLVFYSNNKVVRILRDRETEKIPIFDYAEKISEDIIKWYKVNIQKPDAHFEGRKNTEEKFLNNIGQYYRTVKNYTGVFPYRIQGLQFKAEKFFEEISKKTGIMIGEEAESLIRELRKALKEESLSVPSHKKIWGRIAEQCNKEILNPIVLWRLWDQIAISYRTIATDSYYIAQDSRYPSEELRKSLELYKLALYMLEIYKGPTLGESAVTLIRILGVYVKLYTYLTEDEEKEINIYLEKANNLLLGSPGMLNGTENLQLRSVLEALLMIVPPNREIYTKISEMLNEINFEVKERIELSQQSGNKKNFFPNVMIERHRSWQDDALWRSKIFCLKSARIIENNAENVKEIADRIYQEYFIHSQTLCFYGSPASGKSSFLSCLYENYTEQKKMFIACGCSTRNRTYMDILQQISYFIEKMLYDSVKMHNIYSERDAEEQLMSLVAEYGRYGQNKFLIFIDSLDQLYAQNHISIQQILDSVEKIQLIFTCDTRHKSHLSGNIISLSVPEKFQTLCFETTREERKNREEYEDYRINRSFTMALWHNIREAGQYVQECIWQNIIGTLAVSHNGLRIKDFRNLFDTDAEIEEVDRFIKLMRENHGFLWNPEDSCLNFTNSIMKEKVFDYLDPSRENYQRLLLNSLSMLPVCDEIRIRETMYLCKELNRSEEAIKILEDIILEANGSDDERLIEQVIKVLFRIMQESDGIEWYCALSRKYPDIIEMILELGLRYNTGPEYERRYPAKLLTDIYWQQIYDSAGENVM